jgi:hypothetical protein
LFFYKVENMFYTRFADGEAVVPVHPGDEIAVGDHLILVDNTGVRYVRPVSVIAFAAIATAPPLYCGTALSAGKGDEGDSVTVKNGGTVARELAGGGEVLVGQQLTFADNGGQLDAQKVAITTAGTDLIGTCAQTSKGNIPMIMKANAMIDGLDA